MQDYESTIHLSREAEEEIRWWIEHFIKENGQSLITHNESMTIETDAPTTGWGATCNGVRTGSPWSRQERSLYINCLELLAATLEVKCYAKGRTSVSIPLKMDSISALTYINKMGGTISPELTRLAKELWLWCMERNISLSAEHLPSVLNTLADEESRVMKGRRGVQDHEGPNSSVHRYFSDSTRGWALWKQICLRPA